MSLVEYNNEQKPSIHKNYRKALSYNNMEEYIPLYEDGGVSMGKYNPIEAFNTFGPIFEKSVGISPTDNPEKFSWMCEMATRHKYLEDVGLSKRKMLNENIAYHNYSNVAGMGPIITPTVSPVPGIPGTSMQPGVGGAGSGDLFPNMLPIAIKVAAQTIGLDLVGVKPIPGPTFQLVYLDFTYDDHQTYTDSGNKQNFEGYQLFKVPASRTGNLRKYLDNARAYADSIRTNSNGMTNRDGRTFIKVIFTLPSGANAWPTTAPNAFPGPGLITPAKDVAAVNIYTDPSLKSTANTQGRVSTLPPVLDSQTPPVAADLTDDATYLYIEFIKYDDYDRNAIFRAWRQDNHPSAGNWGFEQRLNSFNTTLSVGEFLGCYIDDVAGNIQSSGNSWAAYLAEGVGAADTAPIGPGTTPYTPAAIGHYPLNTTPLLATLPTAGATPNTDDYIALDTEAASLFQNQIDGFFSNWHPLTGMTRAEDEVYYPGTVGTRMKSEIIQTELDHVRYTVRRNELEDGQSQHGINLFEEVKKACINALSQKISKKIIARAYALGDKNRLNVDNARSASTGWGSPPGAPNATGNNFPGDIVTRFDFYVEQYTISPTAGNPGVFNDALVLQRKLITKIKNAANYIANTGRIGRPNYIVTNSNLASLISDISGFVPSPFQSSFTAPGQLYPMGTLDGMTLYVDPYDWNQSGNGNYDRILIGRKNKVDEPGLLFCPYLMAQSFEVLHPDTMAPAGLLRSRYAITEYGYFPERQFMTIYVYDPENRLL